MEQLDSFIHENWVNTLIAAVVILLATAIVSAIARAIVNRFLRRSTLLPTNSVFINLVRFIVWLVGVGFMLSICFKVNVNGILTALGVGGIAISLGMQTTISNLIGGLTVSMTRLIEPGENVFLPANSITGIVRDVTWRHTTIDTSSGTVVVPNSLINTTPIVKKAPPSAISIPIVVTSDKDRLTATAHSIEDVVEKAVSRVSKMKKAPSVTFNAVGETGFSGSLSFTISDDDKASWATDAAIRAAAPYIHSHAGLKIAQALEQSLEEQTKALEEAAPAADVATTSEADTVADANTSPVAGAGTPITSSDTSNTPAVSASVGGSGKALS